MYRHRLNNRFTLLLGVFGMAFAALLLCGSAGTVHAATAFVQIATTTTSGGVSTRVATFPSNVTNGDVIVFGVVTGVSVTNVTASCVTGNLTIVASSTNGSNSGYWGYGITNATGACSVTVNTGGNTSLNITASEISGVSTASPLDVATSTNDSFATNHTSGNVTTTAAGDYIYGLEINPAGNGATYTAGSGYTTRGYVNSAFFVEDEVQAAAGSIAATSTSSGGSTDIVVIMAMKPPASPGGITNKVRLSAINGGKIRISGINGGKVRIR